MLGRPIRLLAVAALVAGTLGGLPGAASAVGPGTFTRITTPSGTTTYHFLPAPAHDFLTVSGETSADVSEVDIVCITLLPGEPNVQTLATAVPVNNRAFSVNGNLTTVPTNCRLRAIPAGVDPTTDYTGSYTGPVLYGYGVIVSSAGPTPYDYEAIGEQGEGLGAVQSAGNCGAVLLATVELPAVRLVGPGVQGCAFDLPGTNIRAGASNASAIRVDGKNAYLPAAVHDYLKGTLALGVAQPALTTSFQHASNGDLTVTESAQLKRCDPGNRYPPTGSSCTSLVSTGVKFSRVVNIFRGAHQIRMRDSFTSTDGHAHSLSLQYQGRQAPRAGATGYTFPGHGSAFTASHLDQQVAGLGAKAGTMFIRSDIYADNDDPEADTLGMTWSRAPQNVTFSHTNPNLFAMPYSLSVPAGGSAHLGFADSEAPLTGDAQARAGVAVAEMVNQPVIGSPANGAVIKGRLTTVKGSATVGANGLPTSVLVNGHSAHLTNVSATKETYSVSFSESLGKHPINVTARDVAGNTRSRSITVTNVSP